MTSAARGPRRAPSRRRPAGAAFDLVPTPLGVCGVAVGPRGVRRVVLPVGAAVRMERFLRRAFPGARRDRRACRRAAGALRRFFRTGRAAGAGPLDLGAASRLERDVYGALLRTGPGDVLAYSTLARRIGRPRASRAVGHALGRNPVPLIVPCHRVIRADGTLGGFSCPGGLRLKRRLLAFEASRRGARLS